MKSKFQFLTLALAVMFAGSSMVAHAGAGCSEGASACGGGAKATNIVQTAAGDGACTKDAAACSEGAAACCGKCDKAADCEAKCDKAKATNIVQTGAKGVAIVQTAAGAGACTKDAAACSEGAAACCGTCDKAADCEAKCDKAKATSIVQTAAGAGACEKSADCAKACDKSEGDCCGKCGGAEAKNVVQSGAKGASIVQTAGGASCGGCSDGQKGGDGVQTAYGLGSKVNCFKATHAQSGEDKAFSTLAGAKATVVIFWNQNCPYVVEAQDRIAAFSKEYKAKGVNVIAVDAGAGNSAKDIMKDAENRPFPVLINSDSSVAAAFGAQRTPEVFVLNGDKQVVYHGAFDSGKEREAGTRKNFVRDAVNSVLAGNAPEVNETPAFGCGIKYSKGVKALPAAPKTVASAG